MGRLKADSELFDQHFRNTLNPLAESCPARPAALKIKGGGRKGYKGLETPEKILSEDWGNDWQKKNEEMKI